MGAYTSAGVGSGIIQLARVTLSANTIADQPITLVGGTVFIIKDILFTNASISLDTVADLEIFDGKNRGGNYIGVIGNSGAATYKLNSLVTPSDYINSDPNRFGVFGVVDTNRNGFSFQGGVAERKSILTSTLYASFGTPQGAPATVDCIVMGMVIA